MLFNSGNNCCQYFFLTLNRFGSAVLSSLIEYLSLLFDNFKEFKGFYLETLKEEHSCIFYSTHFSGLDINVKHWNINENQIENLIATKAPAKPKPKESVKNPLRVEFNRGNKF